MNQARFGYVAPGQKFAPTAVDVNGWQLAARVASKQGFADASGTGNLNSNVIVRVYNDSAQDVPRNGILAITEIKITPTANTEILNNNPVVTGDIPSEHEESFVIAVEPIPSGKYGRGIMVGVMPCTVNVIDADHEFAWLDLTSDANGVARLETNNTGPVKILWKDTGTGEKDAFVLFPVPKWRGDVINVNKTSHGWSAWTAVAADGVLDSDWETADTDNDSSYIRKGVVVESVDADNALVMIGRGSLPYNASYTAGERLWLDADSNGVLVDTEGSGDVLWMDLDQDDRQYGQLVSDADGITDIITVNKTSHGFSLYDAIGADGTSETDWEKATRANYYSYIRHGIVVEVVDSDNVRVLIGRGEFPATPTYAAGSRLRLSVTAGVMSTSATDDPYKWADLDPDNSGIATIVDLDVEAQSGEIIEYTENSHGWSAGDLMLATDELNPEWYPVTDASAPDLGKELKRGIITEVIDTNTVNILVQGSGTISGGSYTAGSVYGMIEGSDQPSTLTTVDFFEAWFLAVDTSTVFLLPRNETKNRHIIASDESHIDTSSRHKYRQGSTFFITFEIGDTVEGESVKVSGVLYGYIGTYEDTPATVTVYPTGIGSRIDVETKSTSYDDGHTHTFDEWRTTSYMIAENDDDSGVAINDTTWTDICDSILLYDTSGFVSSAKIQAKADAEYIWFQVSTLGSPSSEDACLIFER